MLNLSKIETENASSWITSTFEEAPFSGILLTITSLVTKIFSNFLAAPLLGFGISIITTSVIKKGIAHYNNNLLVSIRKEIYKINKKHPNLQITAVIISFVSSFFCRSIGIALGFFVGAYSTWIFDVERAKLLQIKNRKQVSNEV